MAFRAMLRGGLAIVNDPLVLYRRHSSNSFAITPVREALSKLRTDEELGVCYRRYQRILLRIAATYGDMQNDLRRAKERSWIEPASHAFLSIEARRQETISAYGPAYIMFRGRVASCPGLAWSG